MSTSLSKAQAFLNATKKRRTNYAITDAELPLTESDIVSIVQQALLDSPSPWNVSSSRAIIVFNNHHKRLFNDVIHTNLKATMPADRQEFIARKIQGFSAGAGAVLFFEDQEALRELAVKQPQAVGAIPEYSDVSTGMLQFAVWTALSVAGLGCSLQHLNLLPGVEDAIRKELQVPLHWKLKAQIVFGRPTKDVGDRAWPPSAPIEQRIRVIA